MKFDMGLTEMQERARNEVVLPYLDAQAEMGLSGGEEGLCMPEKDADD